MADQNQIDSISVLISDIVDKAREELVFDLDKLAKQIDNNEQFITALNNLDITETLRSKISKATAFYTSAHTSVLESTVQFANIPESTLAGLISLNKEVFDNTIVVTVASHIKNELAKGIVAGMTTASIIESVTNASITKSQVETLVTSTLNDYSRSVTNTMMIDAPSNTLYNYVGPVDEKTRPACLEYISADKLTLKQIKQRKWEDSLKKGGGFNCRHQWEPSTGKTTPFHKPKEAKKKIEEAKKKEANAR